MRLIVILGSILFVVYWVISSFWGVILIVLGAAFIQDHLASRKTPSDPE